MNSFFPEDSKKIKARIRSYERALAKDQDDGAGKRYLLGPMYLLLDDVDGALKHFAWFDRVYSDDCGDPYQYLCWTLVFFKAEKLEDAKCKLKQTMFQNLYLLPFMLGDNPRKLDIWHSTNLEQLDYAQEIPVELLNLWDENSKTWARSTWNTPDFTRDRNRVIAIDKELKTAKVGTRRNVLVNELFRLKHG
jgi:hypothetical protein